MYIPNSGNAESIVTLDLDTAWYPTHAADGSMHYRYYQLSSNGHAHFLHFLNGVGDVDSATRLALPPQNSAFYSSNAKKFYLNMTGSQVMNAGDSISWAYGRGPYKYSQDQTVLASFDFNGGYIVALDWHNGHSGYVHLPEYMTGLKVEVLEKTDSVTGIQDYVSLDGIKAVCDGYGYAVLLIK